MPWVTKFDQAAQDKKDDYENLGKKLKLYHYQLLSSMSEVDGYKRGISYVVTDTGDLLGEYLEKYELVRDDFFTSFDLIYNDFDNFCNDLSVAISDCDSKELEWEAKIYTDEWEEEKVDVKNKNSKVRDR